MYALGQPPAVTLSISRSNADVVIAWPSDATGYVLETTASLPATTWAPVPGVANNSVKISPAARAFYRLRK